MHKPKAIFNSPSLSLLSHSDPTPLSLSLSLFHDLLFSHLPPFAVLTSIIFNLYLYLSLPPLYIFTVRTSYVYSYYTSIMHISIYIYIYTFLSVKFSAVRLHLYFFSLMDFFQPPNRRKRISKNLNFFLLICFSLDFPSIIFSLLPSKFQTEPTSLVICVYILLSMSPTLFTLYNFTFQAL